MSNLEDKNNKKVIKKGYYSSSGIKVDIPFVPSSDEKVEIMMELIGDVKGKKVADLGAGDGKLLLALIKKGAVVHGYELEPKLAEAASERLKKEGYRCQIFLKNFLEADLSQYDALTIYGITSMMGKLEKKLDKELKDDAILVSNTFELPNWEPTREKESVYLYGKNSFVD